MGLRVGFIISHPFQYQFYAPIAEKLIEPVFVLEGRAKTPFHFSEDFVTQLNGSVVRLDTGELRALDGLVDVVFCMTPIHVLKLFKVSKVVALQYSLAKEVYQYGPWRIPADLNLMQGQYSHDKIVGFCASEIVGNPRYDGCSFKEVGGGGLLYMPTYGELSSLPHFIQALPTLPDDINIRVKLHHASEFTDTDLVHQLAADSRVTLIDGYANALEDIARADVVVSDYSGAIFDAVYLDRPIALFQPSVEQTILRTNAESIEIAEAQSIGPVASTAEELYPAIKRATDERHTWKQSRDALRERIYSYEGKSADRIIAVVSDLMDGQYDPPATKRELRETYVRYIEDNRRLSAANKAKKASSLKATAAKKPAAKKPPAPMKRKAPPLSKKLSNSIFSFFKR